MVRPHRATRTKKWVFATDEGGYASPAVSVGQVIFAYSSGEVIFFSPLRRNHMTRRTKIVATIGPACWDEPVLRQLLSEGVDVVRINFSHADHTRTAELIKLIRRLADELGRTIAILGDLQGP